MTNARTIGSTFAIPIPASNTLTYVSTMAVGANHGHTTLHLNPSTSPVVDRERISDHTACLDAAYGAGCEGVDKKDVNDPVSTKHWSLATLFALSSLNAFTARCVV